MNINWNNYTYIIYIFFFILFICLFICNIYEEPFVPSYPEPDQINSFCLDVDGGECCNDIYDCNVCKQGGIHFRHW